MRPPAEDESLFQHVSRSTRNCFHSVFGCLQTSDEKAKIAYKEYLIESRKKKFGVDYMNLKKTATAEDGKEEALEECVVKCLKDIEGMEQEIASLRQEIDRVENETKGKIQAKPGTSPATTTAGATTPTSPKPEAHTSTPAATPAPAAAAATTTTSTDPPPPASTKPTAEPTPAPAPAPAPAGETGQEQDMEEVNLESDKKE